MYKLSDFKGDEAVDLLIELSPGISDIIDIIKKDNTNFFYTKDGEEFFNEKKFIKKLPDLIKNNKDIAFKILAPLNKMSVEEYKNKITALKLLKDIRNLLQDLSSDEDLLTFFD